MSQSQYKIHTIPPNLCKEETIVQMVEVLDQLNDVAKDIFTRINKRLNENTNKLENISQRIDKASAKVENLKDDKKAKTVFSSSKYPAADINKDYVSIFSDVSPIEQKEHKITYNEKYSSTYEPLSKLQFFHVKTPNVKKSTTLKGLGEIPKDVQGINDLLLFNTGKNIYKDFQSVDPLKKIEIFDTPTADYAQNEMGSAPPSISQRSLLKMQNKDEFFYTPNVEELPDLDVPFDLPDLPGIADGIRYEIDGDEPSIAPSAFTNLDLEIDLPDLGEMQIMDESLPVAPPTILPEIPKPPKAPVPETIIPPTPHPRKLSNKPSDSEISSSKDNLPISQEILPMPVLLPSQIVESSPVSNSINDSRSSLMDAIRKAGGSKNLKKIVDTTSNSTNKVNSAGDLMADLHSKLMMRRKGISGSKNAENQGNISTMDTASSAFARLSNIIPAPRKNSDVGSGISTDEDEAWNDED